MSRHTTSDSRIVIAADPTPINRGRGLAVTAVTAARVASVRMGRNQAQRIPQHVMEKGLVSPIGVEGQIGVAGRAQAMVREMGKTECPLVTPVGKRGTNVQIAPWYAVWSVQIDRLP